MSSEAETDHMCAASGDTPSAPGDGDGAGPAQNIIDAVWALMKPSLGPTLSVPAAYVPRLAEVRSELARTCRELPPRKLARLGELVRLASASDPLWFLAQLPDLDQKVYRAAARVHGASAAASRAATAGGPEAQRAAILGGSPIVYEGLDVAGPARAEISL